MSELASILDLGGGKALQTMTASHLNHNDYTGAQDKHTFKRARTSAPPATPGTDGLHPVVNEYIQRKRDSVADAVDTVLAGRLLRSSYHTYYLDAESLCRIKHLEQSQMAAMVYTKLETHFSAIVVPQIELALQEDDLVVSVTRYLAAYSDWEQKLTLLSKLLLYLDRAYLHNHASKHTIQQFGNDLFVNNLLVENGLANITLTKLKTLLRQLRQDPAKTVETPAKNMAIIIIKLNHDAKINILNDLLGLIVLHYNVLKLEWLKHPETYFHTVFSKISYEVTLFKDCGVDKVFLRELLLKLKWHLIFYDFSAILKLAMTTLLQPQNLPQLRLVYTYCLGTEQDYSVDCMKILSLHWKAAIMDQIRDVANTSKDIVVSLNELWRQYSAMVSTVFDNNSEFPYKFRHAFIDTLDKKGVNATVMRELCRFCDSYFKNKSGLSFGTFKEMALVIFNLLNTKISFLQHYKKDLSKRLLLYKATNITQEEELVNGLLKEVGNYTDEATSFKVMFAELQLSSELTSLFKLTSGIEFQPYILHRGHWPVIPSNDDAIVIPPVLEQTLKEFTKHYHELNDSHKNRTLDWSSYALHQLVISADFALGPKELHVNLLQAVVIYLFNDGEQYSFNEIMESTKMDERLLRRVLGSLSDRYKILVADGPLYSYNGDFSDKSSKIRLPLSREKEAKVTETSPIVAVHDRTDEYRSVIAKIIKQGRQIRTTDVLNQGLQQLEKRGPVNIQDMKRAIEYLIENEYVLRDHESLVYVP